MVDRTGLGTTTLHYLTIRQAMASAHRTVHSKIMLTCWLTWQTECFTPLSRCSGSPFPGFVQVFFALIVQIKLSEWAVTKTQLTCTVDYPTTSMDTSAIHLCSIKSSLPSLYPLRHSRDTVLTRNYAPPFCWSGLATSMGGTYNWIRVISLVYTPPFLDTVVCDKCNSAIM